MYLFKRGQYYYVEYHDEESKTQKRISTRCINKKQSLQFVTNLKAKLQKPIKVRYVSLEEFKDEYLEHIRINSSKSYFITVHGWRMYQGNVVPGFPAHPHRGFETVTVVLNDFVDHSDSHGASGRYGNGDIQWMTAGSGLQHSEMFPLIDRNNSNQLELFQIWLNLPKSKKFSQPYYKMLWAEDIPIVTEKDKNGRSTEITVIAGKINDVTAPSPAPDSWANEAENEVGIWLVKVVLMK